MLKTFYNKLLKQQITKQKYLYDYRRLLSCSNVEPKLNVSTTTTTKSSTNNKTNTSTNTSNNKSSYIKPNPIEMIINKTSSSGGGGGVGNTKTFGSLKDSLRKSRHPIDIHVNDDVDDVGGNVAYGQPTFYTHPHLINENELCPGIPLKEFQIRRYILMKNIQKCSVDTRNVNMKNHVVIIPSAIKKYMSDKIPYVFRQNSDFYYLTGCLEPDSILLMWIDQHDRQTSILFMRPKDENAELWDGTRTGCEKSIELFGVDESYPINEFDSFIKRFIKSQQTEPFLFWYNGKESEQQHLTEIIQKNVREFQEKYTKIESPTIFVQRQRLIKSLNELNLMKTSCNIASQCINQTIKESRIGDSEHHIFAKIDYYCRMNGANYLAYPPVVASGKNATTIHYINNSQKINDGDLILLDAGCEYGGYSSDITRTWPINGQFNDSQLVLYEILSTVQNELIDCLLKDGGQTLDGLFDTMCHKIGKYLQEIGIIPKSVSAIEMARQAFTFCPHHVSHYLGMDVHDTPLISRNNHLLPGMIFTVEPGIYISHTRKDCPREFRGIGMRIEDDVYVTQKNTIEILTDTCIKESNQLQSLICTES